MARLLGKLRSLSRLFQPRVVKPDETTEEKWTADFGKPKAIPFTIKSETTYDANLRKSGSGYCLALGLKKNSSIAWSEASDLLYQDFVLEGKLHIDNRGGYSSAGMMFRMQNDRAYYSFLISNKGFFRLDVVRNGVPFPLVGWTEIPDCAAAEIAANRSVDFTIIAYGNNFIFLIQDCWAAELKESSIQEGYFSFVAACYEQNITPAVPAPADDTDAVAGSSSYGYGRDSALLLTPWAEAGAYPYYAEVFLEALSLDPRISEISAMYEKWKDSPSIDAKCRLRLAETFAAMNQPNAALVQIKKSWENGQREKSQKELLLAGRLALILGLNTEAESYIGACFQANVDSTEGKQAVTEMANILYDSERFLELKNYCEEAVKLKPDDPVLVNSLGHAYWNLKEYEQAAAAYDRAFELDNANGLPAKNAANVYEVMGNKKEALHRYLQACKVFLADDNYMDLGILVPKILKLGAADPAARAFAGKWAFGIEDWDTAANEIKKARSLEKKKGVSGDPALAYLQALLLIQEGNRKKAMKLLEEAISMNGDYALFRFRLAENRYLLNNDPFDSKLNAELEAALALDPDDGWINNFAAQINMEKGNLDAAWDFLDKAANALGDIPDITMNRAVLLGRKGRVDEAVKLLVSDSNDDKGMFANCAANILADAKRFEEADELYCKALAAVPDSVEYLTNRAYCLIEMGYLGEADILLARLNSIAPSPSVLEQISYVASKKGEYLRAESACRAALDMDANHVPSLLSLGRIVVTLGRTNELKRILGRLDMLKLAATYKRSRDELAKIYDEFSNQIISCASCSRTWKVPKVTEPSPGLRLMAMPPDDLPAGTCTGCGKTWCIGCAKTNLDSSGRFVCTQCGKPLKLVNEGLKKIVSDWASQSGLTGEQSGRKNTSEKP